MDNNQVAENRQKLEAALLQLRDNQVFKEVLTLLSQRQQTKRREQRSALLKSDKDTVFRIEAELSGMDEFLKIYDGQYKQVGKLNEGSPTPFKY